MEEIADRVSGGYQMRPIFITQVHVIQYRGELESLVHSACACAKCSGHTVHYRARPFIIVSLNYTKESGISWVRLAIAAEVM